MIAYGLACLLVCVLSLADRRALPWALVISAGWVAGFSGPSYWPLISLCVCIATLFLFLNNPTKTGSAVHALAVVMLALDVWYYANLYAGRYVGVEYAQALNAGLIAQLVLIGMRGGINVGVSLREWCFPSVYRRRRRGLVFPSKEA